MSVWDRGRGAEKGSNKGSNTVMHVSLSGHPRSTSDPFRTILPHLFGEFSANGLTPEKRPNECQVEPTTPTNGQTHIERKWLGLLSEHVLSFL